MTKERAALAFVVCAAVCFCIFLVGPERINPWNLGWLRNDWFQTHFAWEVYRRDPISAFALSTDRLMEPIPINIALYDAIPIANLILKLLFQNAGEFQFFGAYLVFCALLQGVFAFLIVREIALRRPADASLIIAGALAALLLVLSPIWIRRMPLHMQLSSHWILLAALWLFARSGRVSVQDTVVRYCVLFGIAGGVNGYLPVMGCVIYGGCVVKMLLEARLTTVRQLALAAAPVAVCLISLMTFGYFALSAGGFLPGFGYGFFSANLLALIDPGWGPSTFIPMMPKATVGQNDGYGYLGLGNILIVVAAVALVCYRRPAVRRSTLLAVAAILLVSFGVALSSTVTLGSTALFTIPLPEKIFKLLENFRASGRYIWIANYTLVITSAAILLTLLPRRWLVPVMALLVLIQIVDIAPIIKASRASLANSQQQVFLDPEFRSAGNGYRRLLSVPPWQCGFPEDERPPLDYMRMGRLALDYNLAINSTYASRTPWNQWIRCGVFMEEIKRNPPAEDAFYVFSVGAFKRWGQKVQEQRYCELADDVVFCRKDARAGPGPKLIEELARAPNKPDTPR